MLDVPGPIDMATVYVPPEAGVRVMEELAKKGVPEVWLNPGADDDEVVARARALGLKTIQACSIIAIGEQPVALLSPSRLPAAVRRRIRRLDNPPPGCLYCSATIRLPRQSSLAAALHLATTRPLR